MLSSNSKRKLPGQRRVPVKKAASLSTVEPSAFFAEAEMQRERLACPHHITLADSVRLRP